MFVFLSKSFQESHTVLIPTNWPQDKEWVAALSLSGLLRRFTEERKVCRQASKGVGDHLARNQRGGHS